METGGCLELFMTNVQKSKTIPHAVRNGQQKCNIIRSKNLQAVGTQNLSLPDSS